MRVTSRIAALALVGVISFAAGNTQAASLSVSDEGEGQFSVSLILDPGELVQGIQIDILIPGTATVNPPTVGYIVPTSLGPQTVNPWPTGGQPSLPTGQALVAGGLRAVHAYQGEANSGAGFTADYRINPDGTQDVYIDVVDGALGVLAQFRDAAYVVPAGLPIARWIGEAPTGWAGAVCSPTCDLAEAGSFVPEPAAAVLLGLGLAGLGLIRRR